MKVVICTRDSTKVLKASLSFLCSAKRRAFDKDLPVQNGMSTNIKVIMNQSIIGRSVDSLWKQIRDDLLRTVLLVWDMFLQM